MKKTWLPTALAALALTLAACQTTPQPTTTEVESDSSVLGTMALDGTMRDLDGKTVATEGATLRPLSASAQGLTIRFEQRQTPAPAIRVVHGSPDTPAVDVLVNDKVAIAGLTYQKQAGPASLPVGTYNVKVNLAGTATTAINADLKLESGAYYAAYALGFTKDISAVVLREAPFKLTGVGLLRVLHGAPSAPQVDVYLSRPGRDLRSLRPVLRGVNFKDASSYFAVRSGEVQIRVTPAGTKTVAIDATVNVADGSLQTAVAADKVGGGAPLGAYVVDELVGEPAPQSILEIAGGNAQLSTLVGAVKSAGLVEALSGKGPFTVFAPTNDAFAKLAAIPSGETLKKILLYHVASGAFSASDLSKKTMLETLAGESIQLRVVGGELILNDAVRVVIKDIKASNGIVHVIDTVLIPPSLAPAPQSILEIASGNAQLSTLVSAVKSTGLVEALSGKGPFTVLAPTNAAFAKLAAIPSGETLKKILLYHVASGARSASDIRARRLLETLIGEQIKTNFVNDELVLNDNVRLVIKDIKASNGIIHVIDTVLIPPSLTSGPKTIVQIVSGDPRFTTLVSALLDTGVERILAGDSPFSYTLFAPTNAAFDAAKKKLGGTLPTRDALRDLIHNHFLPQPFSAADLLKAGVVLAVGGERIKISGTVQQLVLNGQINVLTADLKASNGVVHVIDAVLLPE